MAGKSERAEGKPDRADLAVRELLKGLQHDFGDKTEVYIMGDGTFAAQPKQWISTGLDVLDLAISARPDGGIPVGKAVEVFGSEVTGKSALVAHMMGAAQRQGCICALIEGEEAWSTEFFTKFSQGADISKVFYMDPNTLEDMWAAVDGFIDRVRAVDQEHPIFIAVDSLAGFPTMAEDMCDWDASPEIAAGARKNKQAFRKLKKKFATQRVILILVNQEIAKIGSFGFGEKTTVGGGGGPKFFTSIRLQLDNVKTLKDKEGGEYGMVCQAMVYKNRFDGRGRKVQYPIYFESGISNLASIIDYLWNRGFLGKTAGWVIWNGDKFRKAEFLIKAQQDAELAAALASLVREKFFGPAAIPSDPDLVEGVA